jgi:hypothetical protein
MIGVIVQIPFWFIFTAKPFAEEAKPYIPIMISIIMYCFAFITTTSSISYLKAQLTTPLGLMLPGGKVKSLIVISLVIFFSFILLMIAGTRLPDYSMPGLFALTFFLLAGFVFFYYLHGFFALCFTVYALYQYAWVIDIFHGKDSQSALLMSIVGLIIFAYFVYRVLSVNEESWEFKNR